MRVLFRSGRALSLLRRSVVASAGRRRDGILERLRRHQRPSVEEVSADDHCRVQRRFAGATPLGIRGIGAAGQNAQPVKSRTPWTAERTAGRWSFERSEEHTSELQSLMRISYAVFCLKKTNRNTLQT